MPAESEPTPHGHGGGQGTADGAGPRTWFRGSPFIGLIVAVAAIESMVPAKLLLTPAGGSGPGIGFAMLILWILATIWLVVVWGLVVAAALVRNGPLRPIVLTLALLQVPFQISVMWREAEEQRRFAPPDVETGRGYFDDKSNLDLYLAIRACNPRLQPYGAVCDLDRVTALSRTIDTAALGPGGESHMSLAMRNGPNPEVVRIVLRAGTPLDDIVRWIFVRSYADRDLPLLRAGLDGGLDPNTAAIDSMGDPAVFIAVGWTEAMTAFLDAGARIDQLDREGYTMLMRTIKAHRYDDAAILLARGAAEDRVAADGKSMADLIAAIPSDDVPKLPPAVRALADRHRPR